MPYTQSDLDALKNALKSGVTRVSFTDRSVEYRSIQEIERAIQIVSAELNQTKGVAQVRQVRVYARKGF